ncbi:MAG TPA: hypothetical protein VGL66_17945 [Caulobacteraceae bacterium]
MALADLLKTLDGKSTLTAEDALSVRKAIYEDGVVSQDEAEGLYTLNADAGVISPEWRMLFIEAMTDFVVRQQAPSGYIPDPRATWLIGLMSSRRTLRGDEVELLIHLLEEADQAPDRLSAYALGVVRSLALWRLKTGGALIASDIERLRRVIFAKGGEQNVAVTREEAEALFDINDAHQGKSSDPAWCDFFARAIGNAVLFVPVWTADADTELHEEAWLADTRVRPFARFGRLSAEDRNAAMAEGFSDIMHMDFESADLKRLGARVDADEATEQEAAAVTPEEAGWLADRIGRDGVVDDAEKALLAFLRDNASNIDPSLAQRLAALPGGGDAFAGKAA